MSLGCASCGDCCTEISLPLGVVLALDELLAGGDVPSAGVDPSYWFIADHWLETERDDERALYECDRFDSLTRRCRAHDERPPVCRGFPWYENTPLDDAGVATPERISRLPARCSYALDVPPEQRRDDARPLIPITVVRR